MKIHKYTAVGNSFIVIDSTDKTLTDPEKSEIVLSNVKERDGAIFVEIRDGKFFMDYFNRDGKRAEFCGNGARTFFKFISEKFNISEFSFLTYSGEIHGKTFEDGEVSVTMPKPTEPELVSVEGYNGFLLRVGVPHFVVNVSSLETLQNFDVDNVGRKLRELLNANVNFYTVIEPSIIFVRTYERGVERETKACGSGSTATAHVYKTKIANTNTVYVKTRGGNLTVIFENDIVYLKGGVENV